MSEQPARIFGLYPRKGTIAEGSDADIVILDPAAPYTVPQQNPFLKVDYSMFAGRNGLGVPTLVMQRGRVLMQQGKLKARAGQGEYLLQKQMTFLKICPRSKQCIFLNIIRCHILTPDTFIVESKTDMLNPYFMNDL